ncbi:MAG TPA: DUF2182 domain-containing protein [Gemmatimonadales bacterium]|nr:DUF2182 domain-containing protein [Gemmatimonadales bacterium]
MERTAGSLDALIRRDRALALGGVAALAALAWLALARMAGMTSGGATAMPGAMAMPSTAPWGGAELASLIVMWAIMMVAMMAPAAAPLVLLYAGTMRRRATRGEPAVAAWVLLAGYLLVWIGFSALAGTAEWALHGAALVSPATLRAAPALAGGILIAAGLFQFTPLKSACLTHCRSPLHFLTTEWREGAFGALAMGARHGVWCLGCCWLLMALLFVAGVMNLAWVAAIAAFVLLERTVPGGAVAGRVVGALLVGWGAWLVAGA